MGKNRRPPEPQSSRGVKLARVATGRPAILAFRYGYHGRTAQTMALTAAKDVYRAAFEPLPGSIYHTANPYCNRADTHWYTMDKAILPDHQKPHK